MPRKHSRDHGSAARSPLCGKQALRSAAFSWRAPQMHSFSWERGDGWLIRHTTRTHKQTHYTGTCESQVAPGLTFCCRSLINSTPFRVCFHSSLLLLIIKIQITFEINKLTVVANNFGNHFENLNFNYSQPPALLVRPLTSGDVTWVLGEQTFLRRSRAALEAENKSPELDLECVDARPTWTPAAPGRPERNSGQKYIIL